MDSTPSLQELPEIGNWFSSYEYQSLDLDSNFSLEESAFREPESQRDKEKKAHFEEIRTRDEVVAGEKLVQCSRTCEKGDNNNEDMCMIKSMDSFSSGSLLSEPPDIRNWFSSYVYESSVSDTGSLFWDEVSQENGCEDKRFDFEVMNENEGRFEIVHLKGCVEHNSSSDKNMKVKQKQPSSRADGSAEMKTNLNTANTSHLEKILQPCIQDKTLQHNLGQNKYEDTLSLTHGSPSCNREAHLMPLDPPDRSAMRPPKLVQKNDTKDAKSKAEIQHDKRDMSASLVKSFSPSSTCTGNKENDDFVTARKNSCTGANDENSWKKPEKKLLHCSTNTRTVSLAGEKHAVTKRKALTEATNLQHSNAMEITGKWQCPQKSKPNLGPYLKQLRLERWVHRI